MIAWFKKFLFDESAFERYARAFIGGLAAAIMAQVLPIPKEWAPLAMFIALMIGAGDKNKTEDKPNGTT